jgi:hypothetical protein
MVRAIHRRHLHTITIRFVFVASALSRPSAKCLMRPIYLLCQYRLYRGPKISYGSYLSSYPYSNAHSYLPDVWERSRTIIRSTPIRCVSPDGGLMRRDAFFCLLFDAVLRSTHYLLEIELIAVHSALFLSLAVNRAVALVVVVVVGGTYSELYGEQ